MLTNKSVSNSHANLEYAKQLWQHSWVVKVERRVELLQRKTNGAFCSVRSLSAYCSTIGGARAMISAGFTLWRQFNKSLYERYSRRSIIIIITAAIVLLSAPAFALVIYAGYSLFGSRSMSDGDGHQGTMVTISWAVSTNAETKGDRLIPLAAETVRQR